MDGQIIKSTHSKSYMKLRLSVVDATQLSSRWLITFSADQGTMAKKLYQKKKKPPQLSICHNIPQKKITGNAAS